MDSFMVARIPFHGSRVAKALAVAPAALHLGLSLAVHFIGRLALLPGVFDSQGIGSFAMDGRTYYAQMVTLADVLAEDGFAAWLAFPAALHVKMYSLSFAVLSPWLGDSVLAAEPLNLILYLTILCLVYRLGREVFNGRAGLVAAVAVGLWPSFLLHTTQVLRDPLFIVAMLALALMITLTLTRKLSWIGGSAGAACTLAVLILLWLIRRDTWPVVYGFVFPGSLLLVARLLRERRVPIWNLLVVALLLGGTALIPRLVPPLIEPGLAQAPAQSQDLPPPCVPASEETSGDYGGWLGSLLAKADAAARRVGDLRVRFVALYPEAGSNVDTDVRICTIIDLFGYLPRAAAVGFLAPFPNQWLETGAQVGLVGRLASGIETLCMYGIEVMAVMAVWKGRRSLPVWLLLAAATAGVIALGLVVLNVGALYRMRYVYWMLIIVLGAGGALGVLGPAVGKRFRQGTGT